MADMSDDADRPTIFSAEQEVFERQLADASIVAILRGLTPDSATELALELVMLGIRHVEITVQDDQGMQALRQTAAEWPRQQLPKEHGTLGAGSIISVPLAHRAIDAGAAFLVCPGLSDEIVNTARDRRIPVLPGVATPSEVQRAVALGLGAVKLFPAAQLGGPSYLRALRGPFPTVDFVPTGGVNFDNARSYLDAGALTVGIGGELTQPAGLEALRHWLDRPAT